MIPTRLLQKTTGGMFVAFNITPQSVTALYAPVEGLVSPRCVEVENNQVVIPTTFGIIDSCKTDWRLPTTQEVSVIKCTQSLYQTQELHPIDQVNVWVPLNSVTANEVLRVNPCTGRTAFSPQTWETYFLVIRSDRVI